MKTIIRISPYAVDSPDRLAAEKLPALAVRMLAEAYSTRREEHGDDALLVLDQGKDGKPVYLTIGSKPPELAIGGRRVFGVFSPPESQEPIATFFEQAAAEKWAMGYTAPGTDCKIGEIDATDKPVVRVAVTALIMRDGKVLLGKLKKSGLYALPDGELNVGESIESATQRAVKVITGLDVGRIAVSKTAPYISTFIDKAGQHFLTLVMVVEYVGGEAQTLDPMWESCGWFDADKPPEPLLITVQQIIALAKHTAKLDNPPSLVVAVQRARRARGIKPKKKSRKR